MKPVDPRLVGVTVAVRRHLAVVVGLGSIGGFLILLQAELLTRGIASIIDDDASRSVLGPGLVGLAVVLVGRAVVAWAHEVAARRVSAGVKSELRHRLVVTAADSSTGASRAEVTLLATRGLDALDPYFADYLPSLVLAVVVPGMVAARLLLADPTSAVVVLLTLPLVPLFMVLVGRMTESSSRRRWDELSRLGHHFLDVVTGLRTLALFGRATAQPALVRRSSERYRSSTMATLRIAFLSSLVLELVATLSVALVAVGVGLRLVDGGLDLRTGLLVIVLAPEAYLPLRQVGARYHAAAEGLAAADRAFAVLDVPRAAHGSEDPPAELVAIEVHDVSVRHDGRADPAPDRTSFRAERGELVVLSGPSGTGKTTLLSLLLGVRAPDVGSITIEGADLVVDLAELDVTAWHRRLAWLDQQPSMVMGTVADNVRIARPDASDDSVAAALVTVGLGASFAAHRVGERGSGLSAGERRRVALARVVVRDAPVVLLDEPTAGLDEATEALVLEVIRRLATSRIVVMAAHRPAAIDAADRAIPLDGAESPRPQVAEVV